MRYLALATDYDGTLATDGRVDRQTIAALLRWRETGRKLILVTGRQLDDLQSVFPQLNLCDRVVAENGALLYSPATNREKILAARPPEHFMQCLRDRGVEPLSVGKAIVATWHPHETTVMQVIRELQLELQVILNKNAVMVLPAGVNKASGLQVALAQLNISPENTIAIGDAENDCALLSTCGCGVAVANALDILKQQADLVTQGARGAGAIEIIDKLLGGEL